MTTDMTREEWAMLIHDIRNPLATVHAYTQLLMRRADPSQPDAPGLGDGLRHIRDAASRIERLIDEVAMPREASAPVRVDLVRVARSIARQTQRTLGIANRVTVRTSATELLGWWDLTGVERVLANLMDNALKYSPADRQVVVTLQATGRWAVIRVADRGIGIPTGDRLRVMEYGYRAPNVGQALGSGIGLAAVRSVVRAHRGTLSIASDQGVGTTVTVRLPLSPALALSTRSRKEHARS